MGSSKDISEEGGGVRNPHSAKLESALALGSSWRHRREKYEVTVRCHVDVKDDNDARWRPGVGYNIDGRNGKTLVRSESDFLAKFEEA